MRSWILCLAVLGFLACDSKHGTPPGGGAKKLTLAVIPKGTSHEFWKSIHAGAVKASRELDVEIVWKGPVKEDDRADQIKEVENFITRKVAGIVLAPLDDAALVRPVNEAVKSGIPVVIIDSDLKSEDYVSFVATDNYKGGRMAGDHMASVLGDKGKVIMLRYQEGSASTVNREKGFMDAIGEHKGIEVVSSNRHGGATAGSAQKESENLLAPFIKGDALTVDGIYCPNESTTAGMLEALRKAGLAGKVKFVGFDSSPVLVQALKAGQIHGLILQDPMRMGYLGVKTMVEHLRGGKPARKIDTGAKLVTPGTMDQPEMKELLQPDYEKWLK
jgi:ribose transport system substrate-binding protein